MLRSHRGSGRRHVFPPGWQARHATVVTDVVTVGDGATSTVTVRLPASGATVFDPVTGTSSVVPGAPVYQGPASIMPLPAAGGPGVEAAQEMVPTRLYQVTLPAVAAVTAAHVVDVAAGDPDPMLSGARLTIDQVGRGTRRFSRVLTCTLTY